MGNEGEIRCFIALELPGEAKAEFAKIRESLRRGGKEKKEASWVKDDTLHLTLRFLGDIQKETAELIANELSAALTGFGPGELKTMGMEIRNRRVLWVPIEESAWLVALKERIDSTLFSAGIEGEGRAFRPHLTLARIKGSSGYHAIKRRLEGSPKDVDISFIASQLIVFKSELRSTGALHTPLKRIVFVNEK